MKKVDDSFDVNQFDIEFVVDTTGSMNSFIVAAKKDMISIINEVSKTKGVDVRIGIVEYKDYCDKPVCKSYAFTSDLKTAQKNLNGLQAGGGGDPPEAVLEGIRTGIGLDWRKYARRVMILVGDAPCHGVGAHGDIYAVCPSGETMSSISSKLENNSITLYGLPLATGDSLLKECFDNLSRLSGGVCIAAGVGQVITEIKKLLESEFGNMDLDKKVLLLFNNGSSTADIAVELNQPENKVLSAIGRLGARCLLNLVEVNHV